MEYFLKSATVGWTALVLRKFWKDFAVFCKMGWQVSCKRSLRLLCHRTLCIVALQYLTLLQNVYTTSTILISQNFSKFCWHYRHISCKRSLGLLCHRLLCICILLGFVKWVDKFLANGHLDYFVTERSVFVFSYHWHVKFLNILWIRKCEMY